MNSNNIERIKGIIFDMDGVLVDAMPFHCEDIKIAAKQEANIDVEQRDVYLLEGMHREGMVKELLRLIVYTDHKEKTVVDDDKLNSVAHKIHER
jgi:beta-phosphoglucomutase-like phosphatase (HAD superfamily)